MSRQRNKISKEDRQEVIIKLIKEFEISTQKELTQLLEKKGYSVTQATISRDIRELNLVKAIDENGKSVYRVGKMTEQHFTSHKFDSLFLTVVREINYVNNFIAVRCDMGMAKLVCTILDSMKWNEILGTVAGSDTIFIMTKDKESAKLIAQQFKELLHP